jgi:GMP synthase (glutamine-hydrolysing)
VRFCRALKLPTLGICFGHQLLAYSFGAEIRRGEHQEKDEEITVNELWPLLQELAPRTVMRESHWEFVTPESLAAIGWERGAWSDSCPVEAIRHPQLPLYGVQFHPERSGLPGEKLFESFFRRVVRA